MCCIMKIENRAGVNPMDIDQLIGKFYNRLKKADIAGTEGKVAVQFNLTGKITGVFSKS